MYKRIITEDIAKGIAISLVVIFHSIELPQIPGLYIIAPFAYVLVFFFFVCGVNYSDKGLSYIQNIKKRMAQILLPLFICSTFVMLVMGAYFLIRNEANIQDLIHSAEIFWMSKWGAQMLGWDTTPIYYQRLLGPCWFILFLVTASIVFYAFVNVALKSIKTLMPTLILLCGVSALLIHFGIVLPWGIQNAPAIAGLMIFGAYMQKYNFFSDDIKIDVKRILISLLCISVFVLFQLMFQNSGLLTAGELGNVLGGFEVPLMFLNAFCGAYFLITISLLVKKTKFISKFFTWCGKNSFLILMLHLSFVHVVNDILGVPQWNPSQELFCETFNPMMIVSFVLGYAFTCIFILGVNKCLAFIKSKKS